MGKRTKHERREAGPRAEEAADPEAKHVSTCRSNLPVAKKRDADEPDKDHQKGFYVPFRT